jgi:hypothetical protein
MALPAKRAGRLVKARRQRRNVRTWSNLLRLRFAAGRSSLISADRKITERTARFAQQELQMQNHDTRRFGRTVAWATVALLALTLAEPSPATAGSTSRDSKGASTIVTSGDATDFSAARRRRHVRNGNAAAGLAFMGLAIGTVGAIAAQQRRNDYYDGGYGYQYQSPQGYYGGGPAYGNGPYYGDGYYRR